MNAAIVLVDLLEDFFRYGRLSESRNSFIKNVNKLTGIGRANSVPIIWIRQEFKKNLSDAFLTTKKTKSPITIENTEGSKILKELYVDKNDYIIVKKRFSGFFKTNLEDLLKTLNIDTLIIGGVNTHACVRMTAIDAYQRDYEVILDTDCINSFDEEFHNVSLRYLSRSIVTPRTNEEIIKIIQSPK
ncbi:MAG: cysteine hydrolase [Actinobacteria bacterium]|nr:cysteine hydrolase [Actinomycetota bacterium]